jgi:hypothetical protein
MHAYNDKLDQQHACGLQRPPAGEAPHCFEQDGDVLEALLTNTWGA